MLQRNSGGGPGRLGRGVQVSVGGYVGLVHKDDESEQS